jgi:hypothetical protein
MDRSRGGQMAFIAGVAIGKTAVDICAEVAQIAPIPGLGAVAALVLAVVALSECASLNK